MNPKICISWCQFEDLEECLFCVSCRFVSHLGSKSRGQIFLFSLLGSSFTSCCRGVAFQVSTQEQFSIHSPKTFINPCRLAFKIFGQFVKCLVYRNFQIFYLACLQVFQFCKEQDNLQFSRVGILVSFQSQSRKNIQHF